MNNPKTTDNGKTKLFHTSRCVDEYQCYCEECLCADVETCERKQCKCCVYCKTERV